MRDIKYKWVHIITDAVELEIRMICLNKINE